MRTKVLLGAAVVLMLAISVATIGSNMGFKISIPLVPGKSNWVSLPYYNSYPTAMAVFNDVPNCLQVTHWKPATDSTESVTSTEDPDFNLVEGEAILVKVSGSSTVNWVVVGSHDPGYQMPLVAGKSNWISVPYHSTATTALALFNQITNCLQVTAWNAATDSTQSVTSSEDPDFALVPGQGYLVKISGASATWQPAHF